MDHAHALFAVAVSALPWIFKAAWTIWKKGKQTGKQEAMTAAQAREFYKQVANLQKEFETLQKYTRQDIQGLHESLSINNDMQNERYLEFYAEFVDLRVKVAAYTGDFNGH